jgi:hypothetical protein
MCCLYVLCIIMCAYMYNAVEYVYVEIGVSENKQVSSFLGNF